MPRPSPPAADPKTDTGRVDPGARLHALPQRVYRLRALGMGLGGLPVAVVLRELEAGWPFWAWVTFACLLWPHLAYALARRNRDPFRAERRNLLFDSMIAGSMVAIMHFNVLPSVLLLTVATADKINTGIRGLWLRALPAMALGLVAAGLITGFAWRPDTSMPVLLASLPILVIHTLAVSLSGYQLIRKVQKQNVKLDELNRLDALTGLNSRAHWQAQAQDMLREHQAGATVATLMLIDVDRFKGINDRYGHASGDDVLRAIADVIRRNVPAGSHAGRLGGDEFAVTLPLALTEAESVCERIRSDVQTLDFPRLATLRCSISVGLAPPPAAGLGLREWSDAADRAMYRAKAAGRDLPAGHSEISAT